MPTRLAPARLTIPAHGSPLRPRSHRSRADRSTAAAPAPTGQTKFRLVDASKNKTDVAVAEVPKRVRPAWPRRAARQTRIRQRRAADLGSPRRAAPQKGRGRRRRPKPVKAAAVAPPSKPRRLGRKGASSRSGADRERGSDGASRDFRWPARGRVIAGFGANGGNEGINIAVPEGTPVKATEAGTVTYAGSEVKGYGNLVLIRHENGFVSAYAHNGALSVKRGETVKRGQVIATVGPDRQRDLAPAPLRNPQGSRPRSTR